MADSMGGPQVRRTACTCCGECVAACPVAALEMTEVGPVLTLRGLCDGCALCEDLCPEEAIDCVFAIVW